MSIDTPTRSTPLARRLRRLSSEERADEAAAFIRRYHRENALSDRTCRSRLAEVDRSLRRTGSYVHTPDELAFGARLAWRHHARCIGRLFWRSLEVVDCRDVSDVDAMAERSVQHMTDALGDGRVRSIITVFAPASPDRLPAYIENEQITQYAGYIGADGKCIGDPQNIEFTRIAMSLGWSPPQPAGMFDLLPLVIRDERGHRAVFEIPRGAVREVDIVHPDHSEFRTLNLRWYAVPCVSGMIMTIGGIDYPCAPFNGFYMCTEIASRNFSDENRYNLLPTVARALGDDPDKSGPPFWKDRALLELNRAVLHSFDTAGVTMVDHHAASRQYMDFMQREGAEGRQVSGNWVWIVPPQASPACPVFHLPMKDLHAVPNFYRSRASDGARLAPDYSDEKRPRSRTKRATMRRRLRSWLGSEARQA